MRINILSNLTSTTPSLLALHSYHSTRDSLIFHHEHWPLLLPVLVSHTRPGVLAQALQTAFPLHTSHPFYSIHPKHIKKFWLLVAKFSLSMYIPSRSSSHTTYKPTFSPDGGLELATTRNHRTRHQLINLWGTTSSVSNNTLHLLKQINTASCRSICCPGGGISSHLVTGPISLCNHSCFPHATAMPGENLNLIANPSPSELDAHGFSPYDWTTACSLFDLVPNTPLTIFYHPTNTGEDDSVSANSLDGACHMCNLTSDTALPLISPQPTQSIVRCSLPPPKPPRKKKPATSHVSSPIGTSGHALPHKPDLPCSFATYNTQSKLTPDKSDTFMPAALRTMVSLDLSFLSLCETNASPPSTWCSASGISEHGISAKDDNGYFRYLALWAFNPPDQKSSGTTLVWDARIPYSNPYRDPSGRLVAVTFSTPSRPVLRVISIYGFSNPSLHRQGATSLAKALSKELADAARLHLTPVVLGDLNEHPWSDSPFPRPSHTAHQDDLSFHHILTGGLDDNGLPILPPSKTPLFDSFRHAHPTIDGFTLPRKLSSSSTTKPSYTRPSRVDQIWLPRSWRKCTHLSSSVDTDQTYIAFSDHRLLVTSVPFSTAFGCRSHVVRTESSRMLTTKYDISHLSTPTGLRDFHRSLNSKMAPILASLAALPHLPPLHPSSSLKPILKAL